MRWIIGMGAGRCGTRSLAALMRSAVRQPCPHEPRPLLPWLDEPLSPSLSMRGRPLCLTPAGDDACDPTPPKWWTPPISAVALYFVSYVRCWPLHTRMIALRRPLEEWIPSYLQKLGDHNPFLSDQPLDSRPLAPDQPHRSRRAWWMSKWSACYPDLPPDLPLAECLRRFHTMYYSRCEELGVPIYATDQLNRPWTLRLGRDKVFHLNKGVQDGKPDA